MDSAYPDNARLLVLDCPSIRHCDFRQVDVETGRSVLTAKSIVFRTESSSNDSARENGTAIA